MSRDRTILGEVASTCGQFSERYQQAAHRGDYDRADEALSVMQEIERCVSVNETSTSWRKTVAGIRRKEQEARR